MSTVEFELPYPPSANRYWRVGRGRVYPSAEGLSYKMRVKLLSSWSLCNVTSDSVTVWVYLHPKTKKDGSESKTCIDLDNCLKVVLDALQGVSYLNDKQIIGIIATKSSPRPGGGVTVKVSTREIG